MPVNNRPHLARTVMCRSVSQGVYCAYREQHNDCWFAHSESELRCASFARHGFCIFDDCGRIHEHVEGLGGVPYLLPWGTQPHFELPEFEVPLPNREMPRELSSLLPHTAVSLREHRSRSIGVCRLLVQGTTDPKARLHLLQDIEALFVQLDLFSFAQQNTTITRDSTHRTLTLFKINVPGLAENRPSVLRGDRVHVFDYTKNSWYGGFVHFVALDHLRVSLPRLCTATSFRANVYFTYSKTQDLVRHRAIEDFDRIYLSERRFASPSSTAVLHQIVHPAQLTTEQQRAVDAFLDKEHLGTLLWGPPGTGKTTTLVAAVATLARGRQERILVVTPSNEAADLIVERLATGYQFGTSELIRVNGMMRDCRSVKPLVLQYSCEDDAGGFKLPPKEVIQKMRIVVCTLMTSGKLRSLGVPTTHFTALAVDEAGHCTESDLLIACQAAGGVQRVMLAGDHKQLGAMVRAVPCVEAGMGMSPLERLMNDAHVPDSAKVMLTENFRSHPRILHVVNVEYDDRLTPHAASTPPYARDDITFSTSAYTNLRMAVSNKNPVTFVHHKGCESRETVSPSWLNQSEAHMVASVAMDLFQRHGVHPSDIVVLSPYRQQVRKIEQILFNLLSVHAPHYLILDARGKLASPIRVFTVEMFQGREARVVIVSTVRNQNLDRVAMDKKLGIGFLGQRQRANVAISRAKDAMIVFGNAMLLATDGLWREYLQRIASGNDGNVFDASRPQDGTYRRLNDLLDSTLAASVASEVNQLSADALQLASEERQFEREH